MKSNSRVLRGWRDFGVKATAIILTILLATQMVGTPAFASGALTNKQASEDIATTVDDTGVEPSGTEATDTTVPDEAAGAANEPAPADSTQATEEPVAETVESATEPATETPAADPAANAVLGAEPEPAPAPAVEQGQLASIELNLADNTSITYDGNAIDNDTNPIEVPANEEFKFAAQAADGWQVDKVKTVIDGVEIELTADANGEYKVAAGKVTDKLTVKVEAEAVSESETSVEEEMTETDATVTEDAAVEDEETAPEITLNSVQSVDNGISLMAAFGGSGTENDPYLIEPGDSAELPETKYQRNRNWQIKKSTSRNWMSWNSRNERGTVTVDDATLSGDNGSAGGILESVPVMLLRRFQLPAMRSRDRSIKLGMGTAVTAPISKLLIASQQLESTCLLTTIQSWSARRLRQPLPSSLRMLVTLGDPITLVLRPSIRTDG